MRPDQIHEQQIAVEYCTTVYYVYWSCVVCWWEKQRALA